LNNEGYFESGGWDHWGMITLKFLVAGADSVNLSVLHKEKGEGASEMRVYCCKKKSKRYLMMMCCVLFNI